VPFAVRDASAAAQWSLLLGLSLVLIVGLEFARLPAALLLGPMVAAIALASAQARVQPPAPAFVLAQGVVGCLIARAVPRSVFAEIGADWPIFVGGVVLVIAAAGALGYLLARWRVFPGSTAVWGSAPGAATAMVLLAEANGADVRLVAFMQYLRVVCVAGVAALVSSLWTAHSGAPRPQTLWFPPMDVAAALTLAIAFLGALAGARFKIPAGPLLVPMLLGIVAQDAAGLAIALPPWLLAIAYALVGWTIGSRFTREIVLYVAKAFPRILASIFALIAICGSFAALLVFVAHIDPLTAYLATSPGGADSVAIIAASSKVDVPFVMTMQTARFLIVLVAGPALSRFIARFTPAV
jgi:membrane AbrB-like protein